MRHTFSSSLLSLASLLLKSESPSSDVVAVPSSVPSEWVANSICVPVRAGADDSALDVQLPPLSFEAFLSDSINLDIIKGNNLSHK